MHCSPKSKKSEPCCESCAARPGAGVRSGCDGSWYGCGTPGVQPSVGQSPRHGVDPQVGTPVSAYRPPTTTMPPGSSIPVGDGTYITIPSSGNVSYYTAYEATRRARRDAHNARVRGSGGSGG